jgi:acid phosphatase/tartrate-resistant acid phosphatase type 5
MSLLPSGLQDIIFIDTVLLAGNSDLMPNKVPSPSPPPLLYPSLASHLHLIALGLVQFDTLTGPEDAALAETQWDFIEEALKSSTADYLFTAGHYPV